MPFKRHHTLRLTSHNSKPTHPHSPDPKGHILMEKLHGRPPTPCERGPGLSQSLPIRLLMCLRTGPSICRLQHARAHAYTRTHTHNHAQSNPSVSESRLSEMKVQSPGAESQPSKNVPFSQTGETCRGGVCSRQVPKAWACHRPAPRCKAGIPTCSQRASSQSSCRPLPFLSPSLQEREGPALESPRHFRRGHAFEHTPTPNAKAPHFHIRLFFLSLLPVPRESSPGSRCRPASHPKLSPIHYGRSQPGQDRKENSTQGL